MWRTWKPFISVASLTSSKPSITKWTSVLALSSLKRLLFQWPLPPIWWDIWVKNQSSGLGQLLEPHPQLPHLHYSHFWACHYVHYKYFSHSVTLQTSQCHFEQFFSDHDSYLFIQFPNFDSVLKFWSNFLKVLEFFWSSIFFVQFFGGLEVEPIWLDVSRFISEHLRSTHCIHLTENGLQLALHPSKLLCLPSNFLAICRNQCTIDSQTVFLWDVIWAIKIL